MDARADFVQQFHTGSPSQTSLVRRWAVRFSVGYLLLIVAAAVYLWVFADDAWPATFLLYSPRWVFALPLLVLAPLAVAARSWRAGGAVLAAGVVVTVPFLGLVVSVYPLLDDASELGRIRVLTCNAQGSLGVRATDASPLHALVDEWKPDLVFLQESDPISAASVPDGWKVYHGPSGLVFASRFPTTPNGELAHNVLGASGGLARYTIDTPIGPLTCVNVHLPTPRDGIQAVLDRHPNAAAEMRRVTGVRDRASRTAREWVGPVAGSVLVAGDFNTPSESTIFRRDWGTFRDTFADAGNGFGGTKFTRWHAVRIDHILYAQPWRCSAAWVGPDVGSDHRPVIADLVLDVP
jgi:vancomycin resistance protein VanJ